MCHFGVEQHVATLQSAAFAAAESSRANSQLVASGQTVAAVLAEVVVAKDFVGAETVAAMTPSQYLPDSVVESRACNPVPSSKQFPRALYQTIGRTSMTLAWC